MTMRVALAAALPLALLARQAVLARRRRTTSGAPSAPQGALSIRDASDADESRWKALWKAYLDFYKADVPPDVTRAVWARLVAPGERDSGCLVAVDGEDQVVGFATFVLQTTTWDARPACYLEDLFVAPEARGKSAGKLLINALAARARASNWCRLYWHTDEDNYRARALYDQVGARNKYVQYRVAL